MNRCLNRFIETNYLKELVREKKSLEASASAFPHRLSQRLLLTSVTPPLRHHSWPEE